MIPTHSHRIQNASHLSSVLDVSAFPQAMSGFDQKTLVSTIDGISLLGGMFRSKSSDGLVYNDPKACASSSSNTL